MSKLKVLMVGSDHSVKGGITSVITQILNHDWSKDGVEMEFIPTYIEASTLSMIAFYVRSFITFKRKISRYKPDIVHIHMSYRGSFTRKNILFLECIKKNIPVIVHLHGSEFEKWYYKSSEKKKRKIKDMLLNARAFIVLGEKWNTVIHKIEPKTITYVLMNSVKGQDYKVKWEKPFKILFLGVLIPRKGVSDIVDAAKILKDKGRAEEIKIIIAGTGSEEEPLVKKTTTYGLNNIFEFVGWCDGDKKDELLKDCQAMVLPSYNEGLPVSILEGLSYGMPVIATDVGDVSAAVNDGLNGYLVRPGDIDAIADAIENVMNKDQHMKMSEESKIIVRDRFSDIMYFEKLNQIYHSASKAH